jgi:hypothetical protein
MALSIADHGCVVENGRTALVDAVEKRTGNEGVKIFYPDRDPSAHEFPGSTRRVPRHEAVAARVEIEQIL